MLQVAKIIGTGLATIGLAGAGVKDSSCSPCVKIQGNKLTQNGESLDNKANTVDKKYSEAFLAWFFNFNKANRAKLSNSGELLKLIVIKLLFIFKNKIGICRVRSSKGVFTTKGKACCVGGINNLLTIYKISEKIMDNRGSKAGGLLANKPPVKEQRVYGNWGNNYHTLLPLRCILNSFEKNYQINIYSKQFKLNKLFFSSLKDKLNPWFVTGLIDGEGTFTIRLYKNKNKLGWAVKA